LGAITDAAGAIADGDYAARVPPVGEDEVRRLATSFNNMAAEIEASRRALEQQTSEARSANNAKSEFLTIMSHELRTPLNAIGGYAELLEMGLRGPVTEAQKRDLDRIKASQQHLLGLISGVLDLSRIESGRVSYLPENVAVEPFLLGLDALVAPQAAAKSLVLQCTPCGSGLAVIADREKLRQVMLNLLSNAIRHTPPNGTVTVSAQAEDDKVLILVEDTGPGISPERHDHIFEPFVQLDRSLTQSREGLGLGLAISRDLARGMGGDLDIDDRPGQGARFVVSLPRTDITAAQPYLQSGEMRVVR
jgi:signal transduction histidine kinase